MDSNRPYDLDEPKEPLTEKALRAIPKGSFRIESRKQRLDTGSSDQSFHSQFVYDDAQLQKAKLKNVNRETHSADSNYLNFSNKSFKKILIENQKQLGQYYDFEREKNKAEAPKVVGEDKLNLINKFREKQVEEFKRQQEFEKKIYIRDQVKELEQNFDKAIDINLIKMREKRRLLGIAMGTEPPPDRRVVKAIQQKSNKKASQDESKRHIENYSKQIAQEIENNDNLSVMNNIIKNHEVSILNS